MDPAAVAISYSRAIIASGESVRLVRIGDPKVYTVRAIIRDFTTEELAGGVQQDRRKCFVLPADVVSCQFPLPFRIKQDRVKWALAISPRVNAITKGGERRIGGVVVAFELDLEGA